MPIKMILISLFLIVMCLSPVSVSQAVHIEKYSLYEIDFAGPTFSATDNPVRDIDLSTEWQHEDGAQISILGFYDSDGNGGVSGNVFKVRF